MARIGKFFERRKANQKNATMSKQENDLKEEEKLNNEGTEQETAENVNTEKKENIEAAEKAVRALIKISGTGRALSEQTVRYVTSMVADGVEQELEELGSDGICATASGKILRPRTVGQKRYTDLIKNNTIVLGIGPAGTGKTYLAVAMAVKAFREHKIKKIILTRPAVEAGEKLGFLPGDMQDKVDPYLRPLYDALFDMFGAESFARYMEKGIIEVAPLAYMRGRTLDEAFIILDEAQNTTSAQMRMFLTRMGWNTKMFITGDCTQIDLPRQTQSGLVQALHILRDIPGISFVEMGKEDIVRHKLVMKIVEAYAKKPQEETPLETAD